MAKRRRGLRGPKTLTARQINSLRDHLDRVGTADIKIGTCRKVAQGVEICRPEKSVYVRTSQRAGSSKAMRRADAKLGIRYI